METYAGLDVSQKSTAVCVIDGGGNPVWGGTVASHPEAIDNVIRQQAPGVRRVGMETGPLSVWFYQDYDREAYLLIAFTRAMCMRRLQHN